MYSTLILSTNGLISKLIDNTLTLAELVFLFCFMNREQHQINK